MSDSATAFAPASIGNLGVGFDMLGLALTGVGDRVFAQRTVEPEITISEVVGSNGEPHLHLSSRPDENTASIAARALWDEHGGGGGLDLKVFKGVPLQSGMGSSAASAVAGAVAANALLEAPLATKELLPFALEGERYASGGLHADNVAPSLLGGLVLCPQVLLPGAIRLPPLPGVAAVLIHPELQINTAESRRNLAPSYSMEQWLTQQGLLAGFVTACHTGNLELARQALRDVLIEPQRKAAVPCFDAVHEAAEHSGALGCSLSGSGPSLFALCLESDAHDVANAMQQACRGLGIECQSWIAPMDAPGAHIES
jgi:homoserine kinase